MRILWLLCLLIAGLVRAQTTVSLPAMNTTQVSVSGLSSGAFMAVQFEVAFSSVVTGAGIIAGGPYFCSQGSVFTATTSCSCTTDRYGSSCKTLGSPYINNCGYDAAGELLKWIYGPLFPRNTGNRSGRFIAFDQSEFLPLPGWHGMADTGYLYVPPACDTAAQADVLDDQVVVHAVLRAFAAQAGLLHAAERRDLVRDQAGVHAHHAGLDLLGHAPDAADVARIEVEARPNSVSLARAITSSSVLKRNSGATGPKVSSSEMRMSGVTSASTVGWKKLWPSSWRLPPGSRRAPFDSASAMCCSTFTSALSSISGPW
jgi:hypothetical protein